MNPDLRILNLEDELADAALNQAGKCSRRAGRSVSWCGWRIRAEFVAPLKLAALTSSCRITAIPGFGGREALKLAREKRPEIPFLFVSGTIGEDTAIEALKNGATDYVLKHRPIRLIPAVDRALREVQEHAECARAEESMRQSEYKYRELFESLSDCAFLTDEATGKIIDTNRKAEKLIGCSRTEILGHNQAEFLNLNKVRPIAGTKDTDAYYTIAFECQLLPVNGGNPFWVEVRSTRLTLYEASLGAATLPRSERAADDLDGGGAA
jgi:PAS domain S-box-containing protein